MKKYKIIINDFINEQDNDVRVKTLLRRVKTLQDLRNIVSVAIKHHDMTVLDDLLEAILITKTNHNDKARKN